MGHEYKYKCARCGKLLKYEYAGGLCRSCATPTWKCRECGREYKYYTEIGKCRRCRAKGQTFRCDECGKEYKTKKGLMQHMKSHSESFVCPECGLECGTSQACGSHMTYHDPVKAEQKKAKMRETCLERYGVTAPWSSKQAIEKAKRTKIEKYGYYTYFQKPGVMKDVVRKSWTPEARERRANTNIERYGTPCVLASPTIREEYESERMRKYGVRSATSVPATRDKVRATLVSRYGDMGLASPVIRERYRRTCVERYGVPYAPINETGIMNMRVTMLRNKSGLSDEQIELVTSKDAMRSLITGIGESPSITEIAYATGISKRVIGTSVREFGLEHLCDMSKSVSGPNRFWERVLAKEGLSYKTEQYIYGDYRRCDILVAGSVALEINPTYTHATYGCYLFGSGDWNREPLKATYHRDKSIAALRNGYQPLCVWDWDDPKDIVSLIRSVLDGSYETDPEYIPLDRPVIGIPIGELDLESVEPNLVWCDRDGNVVDDADDDVDANVSNDLFGIYDCGVAHASN